MELQHCRTRAALYDSLKVVAFSDHGLNWVGIIVGVGSYDGHEFVDFRRDSDGQLLMVNPGDLTCVR